MADASASSRSSAEPEPLPRDCSELDQWISGELALAAHEREALVACVSAVLARERQRSQRSRTAKVNALVRSFTKRIDALKRELSERETTISSLTLHFEQVVSELTDRANRDPKTQLMNFTTFIEQLAVSLGTEQRGHWCALGIVDVTSFKWFNDALGHPVGDVIIERVAQLLQRHVRSNDMVALRAPGELHARFGGDEFCFFIPNLDHPAAAKMVADRFGMAVLRHNWGAEHKRLLEARPVTVDIGIACLELGAVGERRAVAPQLARELLAYADQTMYAAKNERAESAYVVALRLEAGILVPAATASIAT